MFQGTKIEQMLRGSRTDKISFAACWTQRKNTILSKSNSLYWELCIRICRAIVNVMGNRYTHLSHTLQLWHLKKHKINANTFYNENITKLSGTNLFHYTYNYRTNKCSRNNMHDFIYKHFPNSYLHMWTYIYNFKWW